MADYRRFDKTLDLDGFRDDGPDETSSREVFTHQSLSDGDLDAPPRRPRSFFRENWLATIILINCISVSAIFFLASGGHPLDHARQIFHSVSKMVGGEPAGGGEEKAVTGDLQ